MDQWPTRAEAIRQAVALAITAPDFEGADGEMHRVCEYENEPTASEYVPDNMPSVRLRLNSITGIGRDERRTELVDGKLIPTYTGLRRFHVEVLITSDSQSPARNAVMTMGARLRTRLMSDQCLELLRVANVGVIKIRPTFNGDVLDLDGRMQSVSLTDLELSTAESWTDTEADGFYITRVEGSGDLDGEVDRVVFDVDAG